MNVLGCLHCFSLCFFIQKDSRPPSASRGSTLLSTLRRGGYVEGDSIKFTVYDEASRAGFGVGVAYDTRVWWIGCERGENGQMFFLKILSVVKEYR